MPKCRMQRLFVPILFCFLLLTAGCAPRVGQGEVDDFTGDDGTLIDLPTLVITFDDEGIPSFGALPIVDLANAVAPGALDGLRIDQATLATMAANNIQHIQINNRPNGLMLLVNGASVPSLRWDGDTLRATAEMAETFGAGLPELEKLLPIVRHLGVAVAVRFPSEGVEEIPLFVESEGIDTAIQIRDEFLANIGRNPVIQLPIIYNADGTFQVSGLSDAEMATLAPQISDLRLSTEILESAAEAGISELSINTDPRGVSIGVNGQMLPHLGWDQGELQNLLGLAESMGVWEMMAANGVDPEGLLPMIESLLPVVQASNISLSVQLPQ